MSQKNLGKQVLSLFLAAVFLLSTASVALAAGTHVLTFKLCYDGTYYSVISCDDDAEGAVVIPSEYNGKPVSPVAYPYQMITYREDGGRILVEVEQGVGKGVQIIKQRDGIRYRWLGKDTLAVTAPIFLDAPLPGGGRYEAWENYDFFLHRPGKVAEPHQMSWQRFGSVPPWAGQGKAIYHLLSWRVEREDEAVVEAVQRGLRSARYDRGRYAPVRELGTHHFHRQLAAALRG